jgi:hypothetical protein
VRIGKIDLRGVPSSMELMAASWTGKGLPPAPAAVTKVAPAGMRQMLAQDWEQMLAHRDELERGV